jgi:hypothetical protein
MMAVAYTLSMKTRAQQVTHWFDQLVLWYVLLVGIPLHGYLAYWLWSHR